MTHGEVSHAHTPGSKAESVVVSAHQLDHLPWIGYFARLLWVDRLIDLDAVQYNHHRFQNRNRIVDSSGRVQWLCVPVVAGKRRLQPMNRVRIAALPWRKRYLERVRHAYARHPRGKPVFEELEAIVSRPYALLADLNREVRAMLMRWLEIRTPIVRQSELGLAAARGEALLIRSLAAVGGDHFLSGPTGRSFLDLQRFGAAGVPVSFAEPFASRPYPQTGQGSFVPDLSALDLVMNLGPDAAGWLRENHGPR